jgi:hypothetical protein
MPDLQRNRVNLITRFLGIGKTITINALIRQHPKQSVGPYLSMHTARSQPIRCSTKARIPRLRSLYRHAVACAARRHSGCRTCWHDCSERRNRIDSSSKRRGSGIPRHSLILSPPTTLPRTFDRRSVVHPVRPIVARGDPRVITTNDSELKSDHWRAGQGGYG